MDFGFVFDFVVVVVVVVVIVVVDLMLVWSTADSCGGRCEDGGPLCQKAPE